MTVCAVRRTEDKNHPQKGSFVQFSLLMSVYHGDRPDHFREALQSICDNTVKPDEIVLVQDGLVSEEILEVISQYSKFLPINHVRLEENKGLGRALAAGLEHCRHNWVARFDADDICKPDRFELQLSFIANNPHVDAFSSAVEEFARFPDETGKLVKRVPGADELASYARLRNPLNHMAVMFKKDKVLAAGGYQDDPCFEDYALWVRMLQAGAVLDNMTSSTVLVRAGSSMVARRGGRRYVQAEFNAQLKFLRWGFIGVPQFIMNMVVRIVVRVIPTALRVHFYKRVLRRATFAEPTHTLTGSKNDQGS